MDKWTRRVIVGVAIYAFAAFGTFGYTYNHHFADSDERGGSAYMAAVGWPIYWAGRAALDWTK